MKFFKAIFKLVVWLLILLILILVGAYFSAGFLVKTAVSTVVPPITQTTANVADVDISLFSGRVALQGLVIGNPVGFSDKNIFELKNITVSFDPKSILNNKIIVHEVKVDGVKVNTEMNSKMQTNLGTLKQNVESFLGTEQPSAKKESNTDSKSIEKTSSKTLIIKDLVVDNSRLEAGVSDKSITIPLPKIQLKNIGEDKKQTISDVVALVLDKITIESVTAFAKASKDIVQEQVKGFADTLSGLKDLF